MLADLSLLIRANFRVADHPPRPGISSGESARNQPSVMRHSLGRITTKSWKLVLYRVRDGRACHRPFLDQRGKPSHRVYQEVLLKEALIGSQNRRWGRVPGSPTGQGLKAQAVNLATPKAGKSRGAA